MIWPFYLTSVAALPGWPPDSSADTNLYWKPTAIVTCMLGPKFICPAQDGGFDPGQGVAVADHHVAVATGLNPLAAAPTVGTFRGTDASSTMDSQVVIRAS